MALPTVIVQADLEARQPASEIARWSGGTNNVADATKVAEAIAIATSRFRSAASKVFTLDSIDALTTSTITEEAKLHISWDPVDILSSAKASPPAATPQPP